MPTKLQEQTLAYRSAQLILTGFSLLFSTLRFILIVDVTIFWIWREQTE